MGIWGRGLIPRDLRDSPTVDETFCFELQYHLVLELLVDSFTASQTDTMEKVLSQRTPTETTFINAIFPVISTKLRNPHSSGYTQQTFS